MTTLTNDLTAPHLAVGLGERAALLEQFGGFHDWRVATDDTLPRGAWLASWHTLTLAVNPDDYGRRWMAELTERDVLLEVALNDARRGAGQYLRLVVVQAVDDLGLPRSRFLYPAVRG